MPLRAPEIEQVPDTRTIEEGNLTVKTELEGIELAGYTFIVYRVNFYIS
jgi:hypothetical protein